MKEEELWPLDVRKLPWEGDWLDPAFYAQVKEAETKKKGRKKKKKTTLYLTKSAAYSKNT